MTYRVVTGYNTILVVHQGLPEHPSSQGKTDDAFCFCPRSNPLAVAQTRGWAQSQTPPALSSPSVHRLRYRLSWRRGRTPHLYLLIIQRRRQKASSTRCGKSLGGVRCPPNFSITDSVEQLEILSADFLESDAIGVIVKPTGGSSQPKGNLVWGANAAMIGNACLALKYRNSGWVTQYCAFSAAREADTS